MSFITIEDAERILGADFAPQEDKARLALLANTWMKNQVGFIPETIDETLKIAACEIIKGIQAGSIYSAVERQATSERVKADTVEIEESFAEGSRAMSEFEVIAIALIDSLNLKSNGFGIRVGKG